MKRCLILPCLALVFLTLLSNGSHAAAQRNPLSPSLSGKDYGDRPLSFEPNRGQAESDVAFLSHGVDYTLFLTSHEAVFAYLPDPPKSTARPRSVRQAGKSRSALPSVLRMQLVGANAEALPTPADPLPGRTNYLMGRDPDHWRTNIPTYAQVKYPNVYRGIDLLYYGNQRRLEYDFVVRPHADPAAIAVRFAGAKRVRLDKNGSLHLGLARGEVVWHPPVLYQEQNGVQRAVVGRYRLCRNNASNHGKTPLVRFEVGAYDSALPLVIDPSIAYSTFLGGSSADRGNAIAIDNAGNAYVTGDTLSADFPTTTGVVQPAYKGDDFLGGIQGWGDAFVTKFDHYGRVIFSTYLGGSGLEHAVAIALSGSAICIAGRTSSLDFPLTASAYQSNPPLGNGNAAAFVTALTADGSALVYSTYLGTAPTSGFTPPYNNLIYDMAADHLGKLYVTGYSDGNFPVTPGAFMSNGSGAAFIAKLDITQSGANSLVYGTYIGGTSVDHRDFAYKIAVDFAGNAYIVGDTYSLDFPTTPGAYEPQNAQWPNLTSYITKMNATGTALVYSSFLAGAGINGIAVDAFNDAYITGSAGPTLPTTAGAFQTAYTGTGAAAFIAKFNATGSNLIYSTFLGNSANGFAIAVEPRTGLAYVAGEVNELNFPTTPGAVSRTFGGAGSDNYGDAFFTKINPTGSALLYSTYLGGAGDDIASGLAIDLNGGAYLTGMTGAHTGAPNFPTTNRTLFAGGPYDAFVTKISTALLLDMTVRPPSGAGGTSAHPSVLQGLVDLDGWTSPGDFAVLSSSNPAAASVDADVSLPETAQGAFSITLHPVVADTSVTLSATYGGITVTAPITVLAPRIASVSFAPPSVLGGEIANGSVTLTAPAAPGGLTVTLTSGNPSVTVPPTVTVPADATTVAFLANTNTVAASTQVAVTATSAVDPTGKSGNLTVTPPNLTSLSLSPISVKGGSTSTGTVTISDPAPTGGIVVALSSNNAAATAPAAVTVPSGAKTATFTVSAVPVATDTSVTLTAAFNGQIQTATLIVQAPALKSFALNPTNVTAFVPSSGILTIDAPAPAGGTTVTLTSPNPAQATLPATATVPAGATTVIFPITTGRVNAYTSLFLAATLGTVTQTAELVITPRLPFDFDGDGHNDLVYQNNQTGQMIAWFMNGLNVLGGSTINLTPPAGWQVVGVADFDNDGHPDLVLQNQATGNVVVWYLVGTTVREGSATSIPPGADYKVVGVADFNNDGHPDLLFQSQTTGQLVVWYLNATTVIGGATLPNQPFPNYKVVGVGDFNGDGQPDIVMQNSVSNQVVVWYLNGIAYAGGGFTSALPAIPWQVKGVADYNNDGMPDLVFQNSSTHQVVLWFMNGLTVTGGDFISIQPPATYRVAGPH